MRNCIYFLILPVLTAVVFADTFVHERSGESFNGYATQRMKGTKTLVRIDGKKSEYLNLDEYRIERNALGREQEVILFEITESIRYTTIAKEFKKALAIASNNGPLFILIKIDTPGGKVGLTKDYVNAINKINNCTTVAYVNGGQYNGAFSGGAIVALACDKIYMNQGTSIGGTAPVVGTNIGLLDPEDVYGETAAEKMNSAWISFCVSLAEQMNRPSLIVQAMADKDIAIVEVKDEDGESYFVNAAILRNNAKITDVLTDNESLLVLSAQRAVETGIADAIVSSQAEILVLLDALKAKVVPDIRMKRATKKFMQLKQRMDNMFAKISKMQEQAEEIRLRVDMLNQKIEQLNKRIILQNLGGVRGDPFESGVPEVDVDELDGLRIDHDYELDAYLATLADIIKACRKAVAKMNKNEDFINYRLALLQTQQKAESLFEQYRYRFKED